jgi:hypothetical protein
LCIHAAHIVADLISMIAPARVVGDQHDADAERRAR